MSGFVWGTSFGFALAVWLIIWNASETTGGLDACRAAHPGYDCNIGWVVGEAFK